MPPTYSRGHLSNIDNDRKAPTADLARLCDEALRARGEAGHPAIVGWAHEMSAWFALTQGRLRHVIDAAGAPRREGPSASAGIRPRGPPPPAVPGTPGQPLPSGPRQVGLLRDGRSL